MDVTLHVAIKLPESAFKKMKQYYFTKDADWKKYIESNELLNPKLTGFLQDALLKGIKSLDRNSTFVLVNKLPEDVKSEISVLNWLKENGQLFLIRQ